MRVIALPTFIQICLCSLLIGANVTLWGPCLIRPQHRHAISNTSFHGLIWLPIFSGFAPKLIRAPFVVYHVSFWLISISFVYGMPMLMVMPSSTVDLQHPLLRCILSVTHCVSLAFVLVSLSIHNAFCCSIIQWTAYSENRWYETIDKEPLQSNQSLFVSMSILGIALFTNLCWCFDEAYRLSNDSVAVCSQHVLVDGCVAGLDLLIVL